MGEYIYALKKSKPLRASVPVVGDITVYRYEYDFKPYRSWSGEDWNEKQFARIERNARHWEGVESIYWTSKDPGKCWRAGDRIRHMTSPKGRMCYSDEGMWIANQKVLWTCVTGGKNPRFEAGVWERTRLCPDAAGTHRTYKQLFALQGKDRFYEAKEGEAEFFVPREDYATEEKLLQAEKEAAQEAKYGEGSYALEALDLKAALGRDPGWTYENPWRNPKSWRGWVYDIEEHQWLNERTATTLDCWDRFSEALRALAEHTNTALHELVKGWMYNNGVLRWADDGGSKQRPPVRTRWPVEKQARMDAVTKECRKFSGAHDRKMRGIINRYDEERARLEEQLRRCDANRARELTRAESDVVREARKIESKVNEMDRFIKRESEAYGIGSTKPSVPCPWMMRFGMDVWIEKMVEKATVKGGK
jgi:hypothetical protein